MRIPYVTGMAASPDGREEWLRDDAIDDASQTLDRLR